MKIINKINQAFAYPDFVKVLVPYQYNGIADCIDWPQDYLEKMGNAGGGRNILHYQLFSKLKSKNVTEINYLELGVFLGGNIIDIVKVSKIFDIKLNITVVDTFEGTENENMANFVDHYDSSNSFKNKFLNNLKNANISNDVDIFEGTTDEFFDKNDKMFDLIYIDADHSKESVTKDILNSFKFIKDGGVISGDDYHPCWGVFEAVNSFHKEKTIKAVAEMWYFE